VKAQFTASDALTIQAEGAKWRRRDFAEELTKAREALPMGQPVIEKLRREARY